MDVTNIDPWTNDIVSAKATFALAGSLVAGLAMWGAAALLLLA